MTFSLKTQSFVYLHSLFFFFFFEYLDNHHVAEENCDVKVKNNLILKDYALPYSSLSFNTDDDSQRKIC